MKENNIRNEIRDNFGHVVIDNKILSGIWDNIDGSIKKNINKNIWAHIWDRIMSDAIDHVENGIKINFFNTISPLTQQYIKQKIDICSL